MQSLVANAFAFSKCSCYKRVCSSIATRRHHSLLSVANSPSPWTGLILLSSTRGVCPRPVTTALPLYIGLLRVKGRMTSTTKDDGSGGSSKRNGNDTIARALTKSKCPNPGQSLQTPAGLLFQNDSIADLARQRESYELEQLLPKDPDNFTEVVKPPTSEFFIPQVKLHDADGSTRKRVLVLCTGGTLTMAPNPEKDGALSPVPGALTDYLKSMVELTNDKMPDVVVHEYSPLLDSSDMGPPDWALLANDIKANYLHFDGFVVLMGTDTMAFTATALSFMLENLSKPVVFTGSQIPIAQPHSDARRNLVMALIFASRDVPINEVTIFFHDRLIRACRSSKVNTGALKAFDSPNIPPLATVGITINENHHLFLPPARGVLRVHDKMDTRLLALRLVPGFDDQILRHMIKAGAESGSLRALVLQLYGTGNAPSVKKDLVTCLEEATELGILVIAATQCHRGSVMMGT
eukprot:CCRYP_014178-RA/>CCRYP_014178-RA protein AED:0.02 eAED:0.02 QI:89/1/1/1/1/1/4/906/464